MKKIYQIVFAGGLSLALFSSCFKDQGNYDYHEINSFSVELEPALSDTVTSTFWVYKTFGEDPTYQTFRAVVSQKLDENAANMEYTWRVGTEEDGFSVSHDDSCRFIFYPRRDTIYNVRLVVKNRYTQIEYYKDFVIKTRQPYLYSWAVLHGEAGDRHLGAVEFDDATNYVDMTRIQTDAYEAQHGTRRFQNAGFLAFAAGIMPEYDRLHIYASDSCWVLNPYEMQQTMNTVTMWYNYPGIKGLSYNYGAPDAQFVQSALIGTDGKYYMNGSTGNVNGGITLSPEVSNDYQIDKAFVLENGDKYNLMWNDAKKEFYYCLADYRNGIRGEATMWGTNVLRLVPESTSGLSNLNLKSCSLLWLGRGIRDLGDGRSSYATSVVKDETTGKFSLLHLSFGQGSDKGDKKGEGQGSEIGALVENMNDDIVLDEHSLFAASDAYVNQLFYTSNGKLYVYLNSSDTKDIIELATFDKGLTPVVMKFRTSAMSNTGFPYPTNRILAIAFDTADGKGEIHEYMFSVSGDIERIEKYTGFGKVVDMAYMYRVARTF